MEVICWVIPLIFHRGLALRVWGTQLRRRCADCISDDKFSLVTHKYYMLFHSLHKCSPEAALKSLTNRWALPYISLHNFSERTWKLSPNDSTHPTPCYHPMGLHSAHAFPTPFKGLRYKFCFQGVAHQLTVGGLFHVSLLLINRNPPQAAASLDRAWKKEVILLLLISISNIVF